ncbi:MAG: hypothetical protein O9341_01635 [Paucibacter sp.]|nr:hypothetical protein [Roseateles sp.]
MKTRSTLHLPARSEQRAAPAREQVFPLPHEDAKAIQARATESPREREREHEREHERKSTEASVVAKLGPDAANP